MRIPRPDQAYKMTFHDTEVLLVNEKRPSEAGMLICNAVTVIHRRSLWHLTLL